MLSRVVGIQDENSGLAGLKYINSTQKRGLDWAIAAAASAGTLPIVALIAGAVWLSDKSCPPLISLNLPGTDTIFPRVLKIRTMCIGAQQNEMEVADGGNLAQINSDPRILPMGRIIRRTSLDELPQFWQVLTGEWSMVGIRPLSVADQNNALTLDGNLWERYVRLLKSGVKPGVTGFYGIFGRKDIKDLEERILMEETYGERASMKVDLKIIALTIPAVLSGKGAR